MRGDYDVETSTDSEVAFEYWKTSVHFVEIIEYSHLIFLWKA